jgi:hypothetical protein
MVPAVSPSPHHQAQNVLAAQLVHHYLGGRPEDEEQPEENPSMMGRKLLCHACGSEHEVVGIKVVNKVFDATEVYKLSCGHATM